MKNLKLFFVCLVIKIFCVNNAFAIPNLATLPMEILKVQADGLAHITENASKVYANSFSTNIGKMFTLYEEQSNNAYNLYDCCTNTPKFNEIGYSKKTGRDNKNPNDDLLQITNAMSSNYIAQRNGNLSKSLNDISNNLKIMLKVIDVASIIKEFGSKVIDIAQANNILKYIQDELFSNESIIKVLTNQAEDFKNNPEQYLQNISEMNVFLSSLRKNGLNETQIKEILNKITANAVLSVQSKVINLANTDAGQKLLIQDYLVAKLKDSKSESEIYNILKTQELYYYDSNSKQLIVEKPGQNSRAINRYESLVVPIQGRQNILPVNPNTGSSGDNAQNKGGASQDIHYGQNGDKINNPSNQPNIHLNGRTSFITSAGNFSGGSAKADTNTKITANTTLDNISPKSTSATFSSNTTGEYKKDFTPKIETNTHPDGKYSYVGWGEWEAPDNFKFTDPQNGQKSDVTHGQYVMGIPTTQYPSGYDMPKSGRATYAGEIMGDYTSNIGNNPITQPNAISGTINMTADFASQKINGTMDMKHNGSAWATENFNTAISNGGFNGNLTNNGVVNGGIDGSCYGAKCNEMAGSYYVNNGANGNSSGVFRADTVTSTVP